MENENKGIAKQNIDKNKVDNDKKEKSKKEKIWLPSLIKVKFRKSNELLYQLNQIFFPKKKLR